MAALTCRQILSAGGAHVPNVYLSLVTLMTDKGGRTAFELTEDEVIQDLLGAPKRECHDAVKQRDVAKLTAALSDETSGIEALDTDGNTALHLAVEVGATEPGVALELAKTFCGALSAEALRSLLMTRSSKTGYTPLQLACDVVTSVRTDAVRLTKVISCDKACQGAVQCFGNLAAPVKVAADYRYITA